MMLKRLLIELRNKLEDDLALIGGEIINFDPDNYMIEVDVTPDSPELREHATLLISDALRMYYFKKDIYLRGCNPFCGIEKLIEQNISVDNIN